MADPFVKPGKEAAQRHGSTVLKKERTAASPANKLLRPKGSEPKKVSFTEKRG